MGDSAVIGTSNEKTLIELPKRESRTSKLWKWSVAALIAGSAADVATSWGRMEANPALRGPGGRFSTRGLLIKTSLVGGVLAAQTMFVRNGQGSRAAAFTNFALAGALAGVAAYNSSNGSKRVTPSYLQPR
ncbi:MAG TPA: hypothetical protein VE621_11410 [Bryobacteraceae bacterium]|nr:hypothetical protein [Bryobacteraceae bacterium]